MKGKRSVLLKVKLLEIWLCTVIAAIVVLFFNFLAVENGSGTFLRMGVQGAKSRSTTKSREFQPCLREDPP
jgi:hypothetical protein